MIRRLLAVALALVVCGAAHAQSLTAPTGPVIVTVTGAVANTNRGPFDANKDIFFKNQQVTFQRAAAFDLAMLEALAQRTVESDYPQGGPLHKFEGPLLRDVLKAAGATGKVVKVLAIDGYNQEIEIREIEQWPILLALKEDGKYMPLGGFGPTRIVFPRRDVPALADRNDDKWVWAVVQIGVE
jgi:hypothetical protein